MSNDEIIAINIIGFSIFMKINSLGKCKKKYF